MSNQGVLTRGWWIWWALATTFGWSIVGLAFAFLPDSDFLFFSFLPLTLGQGLLLQYRLKEKITWLLLWTLTGFGYGFGAWFISGVCTFIYYGDLPFVFTASIGLIGGLVIGLVLALIQIVLLKKLSRRSWWIWNGVLGFSLFSVLVNYLVYECNFFNHSCFNTSEWTAAFYTFLFGTTLLGVVMGIFSGLVLHQRLNQVNTQYEAP